MYSFCFHIEWLHKKWLWRDYHRLFENLLIYVIHWLKNGFCILISNLFDQCCFVCAIKKASSAKYCRLRCTTTAGWKTTLTNLTSSRFCNWSQHVCCFFLHLGRFFSCTFCLVFSFNSWTGFLLTQTLYK